MQAGLIVDHRAVGSAMRRLAGPSAIAMIADQLLGIADTIVVGTLGASPLAAITAAASVFIVFGISQSAFGSGVQIMGAQAIGARDLERFGRIVRAGFAVPVVGSLAVAVLSLWLARPLMNVMLGTIPLHGAAASYLELRMWSLVPIAIDSVFIPAFAAAGDTRLGVRLLIIINAVHLPLLAVLALGVGTHHPLGLVGAGISSLVSESIGMLFCAYAALRRPQYRIYETVRVEPRLVRAATLLALPQFVFLIIMVVPEPITVALLAPLGSAVVGGFRALSLVSDLTWALPGALGSATEIVLGQRIGAGDIPGARAFLREAIRIALLLCTLVGAAVAALAWPLATALTFNASLGSAAAAPLALHMLTLPLKGYAMTILAPIRASGDTRFAMWVGLVTGGIVVCGLTLGIVILHIGLWAVPTTWIVAWAVRCVVTTLRERTGDWERRRLGWH